MFLGIVKDVHRANWNKQKVEFLVVQMKNR